MQHQGTETRKKHSEPDILTVKAQVPFVPQVFVLTLDQLFKSAEDCTTYLSSGTPLKNICEVPSFKLTIPSIIGIADIG